MRAVVAQSFERIHRSNLVGMGVLPLVFEEGTSWRTLGLMGDETVSIRASAGPETAPDAARGDRALDGDTFKVPLICRIDTLDELEYFRNGGILPTCCGNWRRSSRKIVSRNAGEGRATAAVAAVTDGCVGRARPAATTSKPRGPPRSRLARRSGLGFSLDDTRAFFAMQVDPASRPRFEETFPAFAPEEIQRMRRHGEPRRYGDGEKLLEAGMVAPGAFVILKGHVATSERDGSRPCDADHRAGAGPVSAEVGQLSGGASLVDAIAEGEVETLLILPPQGLRALLVADASLGERIMRALILRRVPVAGGRAAGVTLIGPAPRPRT